MRDSNALLTRDITRESHHPAVTGESRHPVPSRPVPTYTVVTSVGGCRTQPNPNRHLARRENRDDLGLGAARFTERDLLDARRYSATSQGTIRRYVVAEHVRTFRASLLRAVAKTSTRSAG